MTITNLFDYEPDTLPKKLEVLTYMAVCYFDETTHSYPYLVKNLQPKFSIMNFLPAHKYTFAEHMGRFFDIQNNSNCNILRLIVREQTDPWPYLLLTKSPHYIFYKPKFLCKFQIDEVFSTPKHVFVCLARQINHFSINFYQEKLNAADLSFVDSLNQCQFLFYALHGSLESTVAFYFIQQLKILFSVHLVRLPNSFLKQLTDNQIEILANYFYSPLVKFLEKIKFKNILWPFNISGSLLFVVARTNTKWFVERDVDSSILLEKSKIGFLVGNELWTIKFLPTAHYEREASQLINNLQIIRIQQLPELEECLPIVKELNNDNVNQFLLPNRILDNFSLSAVKTGNFALRKKKIKIKFSSVEMISGSDNTTIKCLEDYTEIIEDVLYIRFTNNMNPTDIELFYTFYLNILSENMVNEYNRNFFMRIFLKTLSKNLPDLLKISKIKTWENFLVENLCLIKFQQIHTLNLQKKQFELLYSQQIHHIDVINLTSEEDFSCICETKIIQPILNVSLFFEWGVFRHNNQQQILIVQNKKLSIKNYKHEIENYKETHMKIIKDDIFEIYFIDDKNQKELFYESNSVKIKIKFFVV